MEGDQDTSNSLINYAGPPYSTDWSDGYALFQYALRNNFTEIAKLLFVATRYNNQKVVTLLLSNGANINVRKVNNITPLYVATKRGYEDIIILFLNRSVDINAVSNENLTLFHMATKKGYKSIVKLLLQHGAKVDKQDKHGETVLNLAVEAVCSMIVLDAINYRPDINNKSDLDSLKTVVHGQSEEYKKIIGALLAYGFKINAEDTELLHAAIKGGHLKIIKSLLKHSTDLNYLLNFKLEENFTPLHITVYNKQEEIRKLLISYGVDINTQDNTGKTSIFCTIQNADAKFTKLILTNKANIKDIPAVLNNIVQKNCLKIVKTLMHYNVHFTISRAIKNPFGFLTNKDLIINVMAVIAKLLLSKGANAKAKTVYDITPLQVATQKGYAKIVETLLEYNANVHCRMIQNLTPLHLAVEKGLQNIFKILLKFGADINSRDFDGRTAFHFTTQKSYTHIVENILEYNADVNCGSLLHIAAENGFQNIIKILLKFGANINTRDIDGRIALHVATHKGYTQIVESLLEYNADVNCKLPNGCTPLHIAAEKGFQEIMKFLFKFGANINTRDIDGRTALHVATHKGYTQIVESLLAYNADVNCRLPNGYTPLHIAAENGFQEIIEILLKVDADVNLSDIEGRTALYIASLKNYYDVVTTLLEYGSHFNFIRVHNKTMLVPDLIGINLLYIEFYFYFDNYLNQESRFLSNKILEAYIREAIKLKVANLYVNERNLQSLRFDDMGDFIAQCENEIANMKSEKIDNSNLSFYAILIKDTTLLATCMRNENIVQVLKSKIYETKFPKYAKKITCNFEKAMYRKQLQKKGIEMFHFLFNNTLELPPDCIEKIVSYWNNKDIKTLFDACNSNQEIRRSFTRNTDF